MNTIIRYGLGETLVGPVIVARTAKGVCAVQLRAAVADAVAEMRRAFPRAELVRDDRAVSAVVKGIGAVLRGGRDNIPLDMHGTPFQQKVWQELRRLPAGSTCSYRELARRVGRPTAVRAVAGACARNPVAIFVPCHRVVRRDGSLGGYRWGLSCKQTLLNLEARRYTSRGQE